jgi:hypothetical protein
MGKSISLLPMDSLRDLLREGTKVMVLMVMVLMVMGTKRQPKECHRFSGQSDG